MEKNTIWRQQPCMLARGNYFLESLPDFSCPYPSGGEGGVDCADCQYVTDPELRQEAIKKAILLARESN